MFNSAILDIAIGMVFLYTLISLLCSSIKEWISQYLSMRAKNLEAGLLNLLRSESGNQLVAEIYAHPLISGISDKRTPKEEKPSYIPAQYFALALMDVMSGSTGKPPTNNTGLRNALEAGPFAKTDAAKTVMLLLNEAGDDVNKARKNLEDWYDNAMDRVGGWYKRKTQVIIFSIAFVTCTALNIDSIKITQTLWIDIPLRQALVATATSSKTDELTKSEGNFAAISGKINELHLPVGWQNKDGKWEWEEWINNDNVPWMVIIKFMGILITTFAASLGAPFWFELLNKIADLRSVGKQPGRSDKAGKGDEKK